MSWHPTAYSMNSKHLQCIDLQPLASANWKHNITWVPSGLQAFLCVDIWEWSAKLFIIWTSQSIFIEIVSSGYYEADIELGSHIPHLLCTTHYSVEYRKKKKKQTENLIIQMVHITNSPRLPALPPATGCKAHFDPSHQPLKNSRVFAFAHLTLICKAQQGNSFCMQDADQFLRSRSKKPPARCQTQCQT